MGSSPQRSPYKPEGAPWRAALSEHAASNSTVGGVTGAALLKEWQQLQEHAKRPRWCGPSVQTGTAHAFQNSSDQEVGAFMQPVHLNGNRCSRGGTCGEGDGCCNRQS